MAESKETLYGPMKPEPMGLATGDDCTTVS